jgi:aromatic ring-opening dioxygenase LigB subunit
LPDSTTPSQSGPVSATVPLMGVVFGAIAPHGPVAAAEACTDDELPRARRTLEGCAELTRRFEQAAPEAVVLVSPHTVHVEGFLAVVTAARLEGAVAGSDGRTITLACQTDQALADAVLGELRETGIPVVGVSFGGNRVDEAVMPMDWGTLIPLWHLGGRTDPPLPVVVVSPARDLGAHIHVDAGGAVARAAARSGSRIAFIASADHGHAHDAEWPYGYDAAAAEYDGRIGALVETHSLGGLLDIDPSP